MGLQQRILELLPEIDDIEDTVLRERVLATWMAASRRGGWTEATLGDVPFSLSGTSGNINLVTHTRALARMCNSIAENLEDIYGSQVDIDRQILTAAALLHDVGKLQEYELSSKGEVVRSRTGNLLHHRILGAVLAAEVGAPEEIIHIIASHSGDGSTVPRTIESTIVMHADAINLESFGATD